MAKYRKFFRVGGKNVFLAVCEGVFALSTTLAGCGFIDNTAPTMATQSLFLSVNPASVPPPTAQDYLNATNLALNSGVRGTVLTYKWSVLEPSPLTYDLTQLQSDVNFYTSQGFQIYLGVQTINSSVKETPSDLQSVSWDSPLMLSRFHALLDALKLALSGKVKYISLGNEVDIYLAAQPGEWTTYQTFYDNGLGYIHQNLGGVRVGVTTTFRGASLTQVAALNRKSDVFILTYYPMHGDFQVDSPQAPANDIPLMLTLAGGLPVVLQEAGYPSAALNGSSQAMQGQFVTSVLAAWHSAGSKMPVLNYFLLHDLDPTSCSSLAAYYGLSADQNFAAYLCSLGLRDDTDAAKVAWNSFLAGAQ